MLFIAQVWQLPSQLTCNINQIIFASLAHFPQTISAADENPQQNSQGGLKACSNNAAGLAECTSLAHLLFHGVTGTRLDLFWGGQKTKAFSSVRVCLWVCVIKSYSELFAGSPKTEENGVVRVESGGPPSNKARGQAEKVTRRANKPPTHFL